MSAARHRPATLLINTVAQATPKLAGYVFSFASAPVILAGLGLQQFGIWALTGGLAQYGSLLDLGVGYSLSRFIAAHEDDRERCGQYMAAAWITLPVVTGVLALVAWFTAAPLSHALHGVTPAHLRIVMLCSVTLIATSMASGNIAAYPIGLRRMMAPNIAITVGSAVNFVASVGSIALGAGLVGYAIANAVSAIVMVAICAVIVLAKEGRLPFSWPRRATLRELLSFSLKTQLVRITSLVNYQTDKIVIAFSVGTAAAGAYELANRAAIAVREMGIYATSAVDVELTAEWRQAGMERVRARYDRLTEVSSAIGFPPVLLAMASAPLLLAAWLGKTPPDSIAVLVALSAAYLPAVTTGVNYAVAVAAGEPGVVAWTAVGAAVANVALTVALAPLFGIWGVLSGTVVALVAGSLAQVVFVHRRFGLSGRGYLHAVLPPLAVASALAVPVAVVSYGVSVHPRVLQAVVLVALAGAYVLVCALWAARTGRVPQAVLRWLGARAPATVASSAGT